jgi:hypothetical protein
MLRGDALSDPGEVLTPAQRGDEAAGLTAAAIARLRPQGHVVSAHHEPVGRASPPSIRTPPARRIAALSTETVRRALRRRRWANAPQLRSKRGHIDPASRLDPSSTGHHTARSAAHLEPPWAARPAGRFRLRFPASTRAALAQGPARLDAAGCDARRSPDPEHQGARLLDALPLRFVPPVRAKSLVVA